MQINCEKFRGDEYDPNAGSKQTRDYTTGIDEHVYTNTEYSKTFINNVIHNISSNHLSSPWFPNETK